MQKHTKNVTSILPLHQTLLSDHQPKPTVEMLLLQVIQLLQAQQQPAAPNVNETNTAVPEQETLDVGEAAEYLRVSKWIIYDMVRCKQIPFFRVRTRIFFKRRELDQWCAQQGARNSSTSK